MIRQKNTCTLDTHSLLNAHLNTHTHTHIHTHYDFHSLSPPSASSLTLSLSLSLLPSLHSLRIFLFDMYSYLSNFCQSELSCLPQSPGDDLGMDTVFDEGLTVLEDLSCNQHHRRSAIPNLGTSHQHTVLFQPQN